MEKDTNTSQMYISKEKMYMLTTCALFNPIPLITIWAVFTVLSTCIQCKCHKLYIIGKSVIWKECNIEIVQMKPKFLVLCKLYE